MPSYDLLTPENEMKEWVDMVVVRRGSLLRDRRLRVGLLHVLHQVLRKIAGEVVVRPFEMAQMTGPRERRMHAAKHRFDPAPVFGIDFVEQRLERRHVFAGFRIGDEFGRQAAAEADMHMSRAE